MHARTTIIILTPLPITTNLTAHATSLPPCLIPPLPVPSLPLHPPHQAARQLNAIWNAEGGTAGSREIPLSVHLNYSKRFGGNGLGILLDAFAQCHHLPVWALSTPAAHTQCHHLPLWALNTVPTSQCVGALRTLNATLTAAVPHCVCCCCRHADRGLAVWIVASRSCAVRLLPGEMEVHHAPSTAHSTRC